MSQPSDRQRKEMLAAGERAKRMVNAALDELGGARDGFKNRRKAEKPLPEKLYYLEKD